LVDIANYFKIRTWIVKFLKSRVHVTNTPISPKRNYITVL